MHAPRLRIGFEAFYADQNESEIAQSVQHAVQHVHFRTVQAATAVTCGPRLSPQI
jgi:hypothetical protein